MPHAGPRTNGRENLGRRPPLYSLLPLRPWREQPLSWDQTYEWASADVDPGITNELGQPFRRSIHVLVVDAGDCGACLNEVKQLNNPYYNMHRLGFFITPTPRHADVLLVVGPVTDQMRFALKKIHAAMPTPKRVVAVGACALSGGVFAGSFVCANGVAEVLPVDVEVPGHPPPPLAILHGLLVAVVASGRAGAGATSQFHRGANAHAYPSHGVLRGVRRRRPAVSGGAPSAPGTRACMARLHRRGRGHCSRRRGSAERRGIHPAVWSLPGLTTLTRASTRSRPRLLVTGLVLFPASIYAGGELRRESVHGHGRAFTVMLLGLFASVVLILIAGDALLFLLAWEVMSILCYLLVVSAPSGENGQVGSGYLLLAMGEAGTLAAALGFLVLAVGASSLQFDALRSSGSALGVSSRWAVFLLTFFGFGVKAGLVPVNSWLQRAYAAAPRAFAPVLAGATLNLGLYGILRVNADLLPVAQVGMGQIALVVGTVSALLGILYATTDNDLKAMLAHSSIENVGIVVAGFGAAMVFVAANHPTLAAIAFLAALYHLINHSLFKTLLFFGVGAVETQTGTRDIDQLGGLIKWMPLTALGFLAGTLSIAALPPFNGFVSEWLTLQVMLRSAELSSSGAKIVFALCGAGLALTAALAVTCFVKVFAMSFLGMRRLDAERRVTETTAPRSRPWPSWRCCASHSACCRPT